MTPESRPNPPRLAEHDDVAGRLLDEGAAAFSDAVDEAKAFDRLERTERRRARLAWAGAGTGMLLLVSFWWGGTQRLRAAREISAAPESVRAAPSSPVSAPALAPSSAARAPLVVEPPTSEQPSVSSVAPAPAGQPEPTEARCRELVQAGGAQRGAECFRALSQGSGVGAEVALYEAARLAAEMLGEPGRAVELSAEYERRFPDGALRGEVAWLRVKSLRATGRLDEAFAESERLLGTSAGRALSRDIHWLRGVAYQDERNDCERAASEFVSLIGEPGKRGDEAELRRADCLERLGRKEDARRAYEQYLKRAAPLQAAAARARLEALEP